MTLAARVLGARFVLHQRALNSVVGRAHDISHTAGTIFSCWCCCCCPMCRVFCRCTSIVRRSAYHEHWAHLIRAAKNIHAPRTANKKQPDFIFSTVACYFIPYIFVEQKPIFCALLFFGVKYLACNFCSLRTKWICLLRVGAGRRGGRGRVAAFSTRSQSPNANS